MAEERGYFDKWLDAQKGMIDNWMQFSKNFQQAFFGMGEKKEGEKDVFHEMFNFYNSWFTTVGGFLDDLMKNYPIGIGKDVFSSLVSGADAYMKLYDYWKPLYTAWAAKGFSPEAYKDLMDPEKYKEVIDKVFGFNKPETIADFYSKASDMIETWGSTSREFLKPWAEAIQKNISAFPDMLSGKPEAELHAFHNLYNAFEATYGKAFKMPRVGKDREKIELMMTCLDKYSEYLAKNTEFQYLMYTTGQKAMEKVMKAVAEKIERGDEIKHYDEFFKIWMDINEEEYYQLFKSEEFSKLQGALLDAALDARIYIHKLMELYLEDFPIALRSEMNDLYKTVYDLKKKVRNLERSVKTTPKQATKEVSK
ncbi:MAG: hypothetical protein D6828_03835 [Nitrospirae bacterium]|nr:MAG: hypothetical protein D6828_03835 [Nitrospirota bacterium]